MEQKEAWLNGWGAERLCCLFVKFLLRFSTFYMLPWPSVGDNLVQLFSYPCSAHNFLSPVGFNLLCVVGRVTYFVGPKKTLKLRYVLFLGYYPLDTSMSSDWTNPMNIVFYPWIALSNYCTTGAGRCTLGIRVGRSKRKYLWDVFESFHHKFELAEEAQPVTLSCGEQFPINFSVPCPN